MVYYRRYNSSYANYTRNRGRSADFVIRKNTANFIDPSMAMDYLQPVGNALSGVYDMGAHALSPVGNALSGMYDSASNALGGMGKGAMQAAQDWYQNNGLVRTDALPGGGGGVDPSAATNAGQGLRQMAGNAWQGMRDTVGGAYNQLAARGAGNPVAAAGGYMQDMLNPNAAMMDRAIGAGELGAAGTAATAGTVAGVRGLRARRAGQAAAQAGGELMDEAPELMDAAAPAAQGMGLGTKAAIGVGGLGAAGGLGYLGYNAMNRPQQ